MLRPLLIVAALAAPLLALGACAMPNKAECPRLREYSDKELDTIQASINKLPTDDALRGLIQDYEDMRDDTRVCQAVVKGEVGSDPAPSR